MTLARTALRFAALAALKGATPSTGPTIAANRVYDSRVSDFSPETYPDDAKPTVIILTDDDEGDGLSEQNGGPPFHRHINLVMEFAMVQGFDIALEGGGSEFVPGYPSTDAEHEMSLDLLEFQITRRLAYDLDPICALFRSFTRVWKHDCHRQVLDETGVKIAARVLTWQVEVSDDQVNVYRPNQMQPTGYDILPWPLSKVAKALPDGNEKKLCDALVAALTPLSATVLTGLDLDVVNAEGIGEQDNTFNHIEAPIDLQQP
jgi:hypothetical protein